MSCWSCKFEDVRDEHPCSGCSHGRYWEPKKVKELPEPFVVVVDKSTAGHESWESLSYYTATQMREYRNAALEEAIAKVHIAMLGADRQLTVRVLTALNALKEEQK